MPILHIMIGLRFHRIVDLMSPRRYAALLHKMVGLILLCRCAALTVHFAVHSQLLSHEISRGKHVNCIVLMCIKARNKTLLYNKPDAFKTSCYLVICSTTWPTEMTPQHKMPQIDRIKAQPPDTKLGTFSQVNKSIKRVSIQGSIQDDTKYKNIATVQII